MAEHAKTKGAGAARRQIAQSLRQTNLDLLPVLHALLRTRSVTASARELGISQPAVSKALRQLRETFADDLIASRGREAKLTERGQAILGPLGAILWDLELLYEPPRPFDPRSERLRIVIRTADYVTVLLAPQLAKLCAREAPQVELLFLEQTQGEAEDRDQIDFFIVPRPVGRTFGKRMERMALWRDDMVCIAARGDTRWGGVITPAEFRDARQVVYQVGERSALARAGLIQPTSVLEVAPVCEVPNFLVMGAIVEEAECLALAPRKLAQELARSRDVRLIEIDYPDRRLDIDAFWTASAGARRGHVWFQGLLARAAAQLPA
ncbi:MAG: LysR family transcriptional regulator [Proteobacteria bacterium]|nr:LysR family transcriptional regulator [Pseudomonadota bacterium]